MRYHLFKVSKTRNLLISDSQGNGLDIANFNVLSLPGAKIEHVYNFIPKRNLYDIIVLFIGGNNLFATTKKNLVRQISDLANLLITKAKKVFVLGIPLRNSQPLQAKEVNSLLASCQEGWKFRGISRQVFGKKHLKKDNVCLNSDGLRGITYILKGKILYNKYCPEIEEEGHLEIIVCSGFCKCLSWTK